MSDKDKVRSTVRKNYEQIANDDSSGCGCGPSCCDPATEKPNEGISIALGYSPEEVNTIPDGADMGLGCGNPQAIAGLKTGETVLDLGSGGGIDCFLAAKGVGESGHVIGVDMTPEMVSKARENAIKGGYQNVEFRLGEIENIPVGDQQVDVIISNCVINLSPEKEKVFKDAFRVLKKGGRLAISDVVATAVLPDHIVNDLNLHSGCISGAMHIEELNSILEKTGFINIRIQLKDESKKFIREWTPDLNITDYVISANIEAEKP